MSSGAVSVQPVDGGLTPLGGQDENVELLHHDKYPEA